MLSPIGWIKPRLKSLCVAFGAADMVRMNERMFHKQKLWLFNGNLNLCGSFLQTLIVLSTICWYFFFNVGFEAQHLHSLYKQQNKKNSGDEEDDLDDEDAVQFQKIKIQSNPFL